MARIKGLRERLLNLGPADPPGVQLLFPEKTHHPGKRGEKGCELKRWWRSGAESVVFGGDQKGITWVVVGRREEWGVVKGLQECSGWAL